MPLIYLIALALGGGAVYAAEKMKKSAATTPKKQASVQTQALYTTQKRGL